MVTNTIFWEYFLFSQNVISYYCSEGAIYIFGTGRCEHNPSDIYQKLSITS